ncbi:hypothetical protein ADUPG1_012881, partial [Aduncisulcus paluster]
MSNNVKDDAMSLSVSVFIDVQEISQSPSGDISVSDVDLNLFPPNGFVDNIDIEHVPSVGLKDPALSHFEVDIPDSNLRGLICSDALG